MKTYARRSLRWSSRLCNPDELLSDAHIKRVNYESPGTAHEWQTWRRSFHGFAPLLFRD